MRTVHTKLYSLYNEPFTKKIGNPHLVGLLFIVTYPGNRLPKVLISERDRYGYLQENWRSRHKVLPNGILPLAGLHIDGQTEYLEKVSDQEVAIIMLKAGWSHTKVASYFEVNERTVRRWVSSYLNEARKFWRSSETPHATMGWENGTFSLENVPLVQFERQVQEQGDCGDITHHPLLHEAQK